jgi:hypothetical protein
MLRWCSRSIFLQVVLGLMLGIVCGLTLPEYSAQLKPLGDGFIKLIKMLIGLIVFCVVVSGISGAGDLKKVGRIGLKSVIYFEVLTTIALVIGLIVRLRHWAGQRREHPSGPTVDRRHGRPRRARPSRFTAPTLSDGSDPDLGDRRVRRQQHPAGAAVLGAVWQRVESGR